MFNPATTDPTFHPQHRVAAWTDQSFQTRDGAWIVAVCEEGVAGWLPLSRGWGWPTREQAQAFADQFNAYLGVTPDQVLEIRASSMAASNTFR